MTVKCTQSSLRMLVVLLALVVSPSVLGLGMGEAQIKSYLRQPLILKVKLISRSEAELATVTAGLASVDDFKVIGLDRAALSVPMEFEVIRDLEDPHILVTSRVPITEPVVQLVVEVVWSSGRMLRQYTVFLDPPTFESAAPLPQTSPAPELPPPEPEPEPEPAQDQQSEPIELIAEESAQDESPFIGSPPPELPPAEPETSPDPGPEPESELVAELDSAPELVDEQEPLEIDTGPPFEPEPQEEAMEVAQAADEPLVEEPAEEESAVDQSVDEEPVAEEEVDIPPIEEPVASEPELALEPEPEPEQEPEQEQQPESATVLEPEVVEPAELPPVDLVFRAVIPEPASSGEVYGPVKRGETLWDIASEWSSEHGHSVNQVMLAIQQQNPGAFNKGNINSLRSGAILRMPTDHQVQNFGSRQAMLEVMRQEDQYRNRWDSIPDATELPAMADVGPDTASPAVDVASTEPQTTAVDDTLLELVPPSSPADGEDGGFGQGNSDPAGESGESVVEELARAQEELANAQQENNYLNERIEELEQELSRRNAQTGAGVEDSGLAEMEARLREDRQDGGEEPETRVVPPRKDTPWYEQYTWWAAALGALLIVFIIWWLRSRSDDEEFDAPPPGHDRAEDQNEAEAEVSAENVVTLPRVARPVPDEEAVELDSEDPETKLDLARAYISMGDIDAARKLLEGVVESGSEEQQGEARKMMDEL